MKIKNLFKTRKYWTQSVSARDNQKKPVGPRNKNATRWCLIGAIVKCYPANKQKMILDKIRETIDDSVIAWNDNPKRKFSDVKKLVEELNI